ncbi:MAG: YXWGXW repeat-containing protein [Burkholderiaceae bacterium]|nr:YXWGXW repeat-containing protein [Burkholderiaceae bacterium]
MMSKTPFILGATPVALLVLAGCSHTTKEVVTPVPVTTAAQPSVVVTHAPPPAPPVEARPPAPGAGYVWQDGYWTSRNGQYEWVPGHWEATRSGTTRMPRHWGPDGAPTMTPPGGPN